MEKNEDQIKAIAQVPERFKKKVFYCIPRYQRPYAWSKEEVVRLLGDIYKYFRISFDAERPEVATSRKFIGALILIKQMNKLDEETIYEVIDGQQRLTTLQIIFYALSLRLIQLVDEFMARYKRVDPESRNQISSLDLNAAMNLTLDRAQNAAELTYISADNTYRPFVFRADSDIFANSGSLISLDKDDDPNYKSATASVFRNLARFFDERQKIVDTPGLDVCDWEKCEFGLSKIPEASWEGNYRTAFDWIRDYLEVIGTGLKSKKKGIAKKLQEDEDVSEEGAFDLKHCYGWLNSIYNSRANLGKIEASYRALESHEALEPCLEILQQIVRLSLFDEFLQKNVSFVEIVCSTNEAFDIFQTVNTAGRPLSCIETFLPEAYRLIERSGSDVLERGFLWRNKKLDTLLKDINDLCALAGEIKANISEIVTTFALVYDGTKLGKNVVDQRRYLSARLKTAFDSGADQESSADVGFGPVYRFVLVLYLTIKWRLYLDWEERRTGMPASGKSTDESNPQYRIRELFRSDGSDQLNPEFHLSLEVFKACGLSLPLSIICRYFVKWQISQNDENAKDVALAAKSLLAFASLWLSGTEQTKGIDGVFRNYMSGQNPCSVARCRDEQLEVADLRIYLLNAYRTERDPDFSLKAWQDGLKAVAMAGSRANLAKFLQLVYMEDSEVNKGSSIGIRRRVLRESAPQDSRLQPANWELINLLELEHILPQKPEGEWDKILAGYNLEQRNRQIQQLGNITFLPKVVNILASNREWKFKQALYGALADNGGSKIVEDQAKLELTQDQKEIIKKNIARLRSYPRSDWTNGYQKLLKWDNTTINKRTDAIAKIVWPRLCDWLAPDRFIDGVLKKEPEKSNIPEAKPAGETPQVSAEGENNIKDVLETKQVLASNEQPESTFQRPTGRSDIARLFNATEQMVCDALSVNSDCSENGVVWRDATGAQVDLTLMEGLLTLHLTGKTGFRIKAEAKAHEKKGSDYYWYYRKVEEFEKVKEALRKMLIRWQQK